MIKGTKAGLTLHLDDSCSYSELLLELNEKLSTSYHEQVERPLISVRVQTGNRYLTEEQEEEIKYLVRHKNNLIVDKIESNVITKEEATKRLEEMEIIPVAKIIRSGQVLEVPGDLLLIGDVNPGGMVKAGGNIYILGALKGVAHAGCNGNKEAVIAASAMAPSQLRISELINRSPDYFVNKQREMQCAYISENGKITVDRLQTLMRLRPSLTRLKGGL